MPYITQNNRDAISLSIDNVIDPGDLNYIITKAIIGSFMDRPKYETIHELRKDFVTDPKGNPFLTQLRRVYGDRFTVADIYTAAAEAYAEFRQRVVTQYEAMKREQNGDLPEYEALINKILEMRDAKSSGDQREEAVGEVNASESPTEAV